MVHGMNRFDTTWFSSNPGATMLRLWTRLALLLLDRCNRHTKDKGTHKGREKDL